MNTFKHVEPNNSASQWVAKLTVSVFIAPLHTRNRAKNTLSF